jgi:hypothetical protein
LLDYRQKCDASAALALDNGFGLAWQTRKAFEFKWPDLDL